jgi:predicted nucleic acid-binding protein
MTKILLDINVLLDLLLLRDRHEEAARILDLAENRALKACVSSHEMTTLAYLLEKAGRKPEEIRKVLTGLLDLVEVFSVNRKILEVALRSRIEDYEDAVLEAVSIENEVRFIVTRNVKDFAHSKVRAATPSAFLEGMGEKRDGFSVEEPKPAYRTRSRRRRVR